jgi:aryl-alcohol dehydrogenase-like predicted oxidoreductase
VREALALPGVAKFVSSQPQYSALHREPEAELFGLCEANGISQVVWSPLAQGVLTGKYRPGEPPPPDSRAGSRQMGRFIGGFLQRATLERVQRFVRVAEGAGMTPSQLALAWVLRERNVASAIVGASRPEQVRENAAAAGRTLSADTLAAIDDALAPAQTSLF